MITAMSTSVPLGTPCTHTEVSASPRAMFTGVMISPMVTASLPSQSPIHGLGVGGGGAVRVGVGTIVAETVGVGVIVATAVTVGV